MAIEVETKDCTALSDAELAEMADLCADGPAGFEFGLLSKQAEAWVLITQARESGKLKGFSFCTLERIGGTPCVLIGLASVKRTSKRDAVLQGDHARPAPPGRAGLPRRGRARRHPVRSPSGFEAFKSLKDIVPRPGHKATGEERAWGRRLAKRFGVEGTYDERTFSVKGNGRSPACSTTRP